VKSKSLPRAVLAVADRQLLIGLLVTKETVNVRRSGQEKRGPVSVRVEMRMRTVTKRSAVAALLSLTLAVPPRACAQYTGNFQTNVISGVTTNVPGYIVGNNTFADVLIIRNGGALVSSGDGDLGETSGSSNNSALVTGSGSVWSNDQMLVGYLGGHNSLIISNGGQVIVSGMCDIGELSSSNSVFVTGSGSVWYSGALMFVGDYGASNRLVISGGGQVIGATSTIIGSSASNNSAFVTGTGSVWSNTQLRLWWVGNSLVISNGGQVVVSGTCDIDGSSNSVRVVDGGVWQNNPLTIGVSGSGNSLVIAGGFVTATSAIIGDASATCDNLVELDSGSLIVTNATHDAVLEVRDGQLTINGGTIQADILVMTNSCASLVHTGGTLIVGSVILDPNAFRITSVTPQGIDVRVTWLMGPGQTNALQATTGDGSGGYSTNGFADLFVVTNNATAGTATNYLDAGGATNLPARYYRGRLVP
jgi:T5SS/PEP-CTERM-associated repeat protein